MLLTLDLARVWQRETWTIRMHRAAALGRSFEICDCSRKITVEKTP